MHPNQLQTNSNSDTVDDGYKYHLELAPLNSCDIRWSEQSLDKVSQMSPELETSLEDEMSGLLADV